MKIENIVNKKGNLEAIVMLPGSKRGFGHQAWTVFVELNQLRKIFIEHCDERQYSEDEKIEFREIVSDILLGKLVFSDKSWYLHEQVEVLRENVTNFCEERRLTESETKKFRELISEIFLGKYEYCDLYVYSKNKRYHTGEWLSTKEDTTENRFLSRFNDVSYIPSEEEMEMTEMIRSIAWGESETVKMYTFQLPDTEHRSDRWCNLELAKNLIPDKLCLVACNIGGNEKEKKEYADKINAVIAAGETTGCECKLYKQIALKLTKEESDYFGGAEWLLSPYLCF